MKRVDKPTTCRDCRGTMRDTETITSFANSTIKRVRRLLSSRKFRHKQAACVVEGIKCVNMLFESGQVRMGVELLLVSESLADGVDGRHFMEQAGVARVVRVADSLMEKISDVHTSQGVMAVVDFESEPLPQYREAGSYLLLDRIMDPGNMGTLTRTAVGVGMDGILLFGDNVDIYNPKCVRATAGTLPFIPVWKADKEIVNAFLCNGYDLVAARMDAEENVFDAEFADKTIIAVGNEAHGLSDFVKAKATRSMRIPLQTPCESLNAAMAGSLLLLLMRRGSRIRTRNQF